MGIDNDLRIDRMMKYFELFKRKISEFLICQVWADKYPTRKNYRLSVLEKFLMSLFILIRYLSLGQIKRLVKDKEKRTQCSEIYVLLRLGALAILVSFPSNSLIYAVVVVYLLIEVFNYPLYLIFVEAYGKEWCLRSPNRSLMLLFINYIEMIIGFAALYLYTGAIGDTSKMPINKPLDAVYFSSVTITTLGYGDFTPMNEIGKILISVEAIAGLIFIVLVVAIFVSWTRIKYKRHNKTAQ